MTAPKVSVIVPNYNHAPFLRQRIDTILAQTFQDFELILLDDCSTDDSRSILSSYSNDPHVSTVQFNEKNSGSTFKQWNKGTRLARGEYVWIAESDDYADPRFLETLVAVLDAKPHVVLATCRSWLVTADGSAQHYADSDVRFWDRYAQGADVDGREECRNYFVHVNSVCNASSVLFRKNVYEHVGGADEKLRFCGDWKLWAAMALVGRVVYLSDPLNYYRVHRSTVSANSNNDLLSQAEHLRVARWLCRKVTPTDAARHELLQNLRWYWTSALTTSGLRLGRRCSILRDAIAIHPSETRRIIPLGLTTLRLKVLRHWRAITSAGRPA